MVRADRIGFTEEDTSDTFFNDSELSRDDIEAAVLKKIAGHLKNFLESNKEASRKRVQYFVEHKSPRYRPILKRISEDKLNVSPEISDKELELVLHKSLMEFEGELLAEGQDVMNFGTGETREKYQKRLQTYLTKVDDLKKSDLANYVFHRKVVLDILKKTVSLGSNGKYAREDLIHELIIPMRKTTDDLTSDNANLWLIDERLAFHNYLASDKPLSSYPITESSDNKEPDIIALNVFDEPLLVSEGDKLPLATFTIIELKRPMRDDAKSGEDKNPIEQALGYLGRIRNGETTTQAGRPIPKSANIPGFCYVICDITPTVEHQCKLYNLRITADKMGYFGYNEPFNAYIEVISFDRLVNSATERNQAFFAKLGLPTS